MLPNLEYANFNRLLVTLGFLLLALSVVVPLLLLRELEVLLVTESELNQLTETGRNAIEQRQHWAARVHGLWWVPIVSAIFGLFLITLGAFRMFQRQRADDERADLERDQLLAHLNQQTELQLNVEAQSEAGVVLEELHSSSKDEDRSIEDQTDIPASDVAVLAERIRRIQHDVSAQISQTLPSNARILEGVRIGDTGPVIDLVAEWSTDTESRTLLVDSAFLLEPKASRIRAAVGALTEALARYRTTNATSQLSGLLIFIIDSQISEQRVHERIKNRAVEFLNQRGTGSQVRVIVLDEADLQSLKIHGGLSA